MSSSDGWVATVDKTSGKTYYYNKQTKATSWTKPENFDGGAAAPAAAAAASDVKQPTNEELEAIGANWSEVTDPKSGKKYYYNKKTKRTEWNRPACMGDAPAAAAPAAAAAPEPAAEKSPVRFSLLLSEFAVTLTHVMFVDAAAADGVVKFSSPESRHDWEP